MVLLHSSTAPLRPPQKRGPPIPGCPPLAEHRVPFGWPGAPRGGPFHAAAAGLVQQEEQQEEQQDEGEIHLP